AEDGIRDDLVTGVQTCALPISLLIKALPTRQETPEALLGSAAALWVTNILVFASWYWRLDAGGPHQRERRLRHVDGAFLFPQMRSEERRVGTASRAGGGRVHHV